jgi:hypothetical protein
MDNNIIVLRLKTGQDIIASVVEMESQVIIRDPMFFDLSNQAPNGKRLLAMGFWLPVQIMDNNETVLNKTDILTVMKPNESFTEYYVDCVKQFHESDSSDSDEEDEETDMKQLANDLNEAKLHNRIH